MKKFSVLLLTFCFSLVVVAQASAAGRLFRTNEPVDRIEELNPDTGAVIRTFPAPTNIGDGCSGLAFAVNRLFFQNCGSQVFELNPSTGAVIRSFASPAPSDIDALGFSGSELFLLDFESDTIHVVDPNTGSSIRTLTPGVDLVGGLTYAGGRNTLFASYAGPGTSMIYEINALTGAVINSFASPADGIYGLGYSSARQTLFAGDAEGAATIYELNADTGAVIHTLPIVPNWSLAADENGSSVQVPTINEWGMMLFMTLAGIGSVYFLRRQRRA